MQRREQQQQRRRKQQSAALGGTGHCPVVAACEQKQALGPVGRSQAAGECRVQIAGWQVTVR